MRASANPAAWIALCAFMSGCLGTGEDRVLSIEATGTVEGVVFFDVNGDGELTQGDTLYSGVQVGIASIGSIIPIFNATSDADGVFRMQRVAVASYEVVVDTATVGDSLDVVLTDPDAFTLSPLDTANLIVGIAFPSFTVEEARALPEGEKVFVEGVALNARETFGDNSVHLAGLTAAIRVTQVKPGIILVGDTMRVLGTTVTLDGQPTIDDATPFFIDEVDARTPETVTAALATTADGGRLDAALVELVDVTVSDTSTVAEGFRVTADDGSGAVVILLDKDAPIDTPEQYEPGVTIDAIGLLVPEGAGGWIVKPRSDADLTIK